MHLSHLSTLFFSFDTPLFQRRFKTYINGSIFWTPFSDLSPGTANLRITCSIFRRQLKHFLPTVMQHSNPTTMSSPAYVVTDNHLKETVVCTMFVPWTSIKDRFLLSQFSARGFLGHPVLVRQGFKVSHAVASGLNKWCFPKQIASHWWLLPKYSNPIQYVFFCLCHEIPWVLKLSQLLLSENGAPNLMLHCFIIFPFFKQ